MRATCIALALGLLVAAASAANTDTCGIEAAVELFPCAAVNGTEPSKECCAGLLATPTKKVGGVYTTITSFNNAGCFCLPKITSYDKAYFDKVMLFAPQCAGLTVVSPTAKTCPTAANLPRNGFEDYKSQAEVKAAVEAMGNPTPPAPPAAAGSNATKAVEMDLMLSVDPSVIGSDTERKALEDLLAARLGLKAGQVRIKLVSKGSTIMKLEITPEAGQTELTGAQVDMISNNLAPSAGFTLPGKYGTVKATVAPQPAPGAAPAPIQPSGIVTFPVKSPPSALPATLLGLPRVNPLDGGAEYEGGFTISNDYFASLLGQGVPGVAVGIIMLVAMVLMIVVYIVSTICGATLCKCCNGAYKPRKFSKRDLLINKGIMVGFCVLAAVGCFIVFGVTNPLLESTKDLTAGMADTVSELTVTVTKIADTLVTASQDAKLKSLGEGDIKDITDGLKEAAETVDIAVQKAQTDIESAIDQGGGYAIIAAGVMFGITFIIAVAGVIGFYRALIFLIVLLSIFLILGWIVWGALTITATFVDDLCVAMKGYLNDRYSSELSTLIPCLDAKAAVETMNRARSMVRSGVSGVNDELEEYAGGNPYLSYLCYLYVKMDIKDLCSKDKPHPFYMQDYSKFVCEAYSLGKLNGLKAESDGVTYVYPDAFCPYPTRYYSVLVGDFATGLKALRCPFSSKTESGETNEFGLAQCYVKKQIPYDIFDDAAKTARTAQSVIDIVPDVENLIQCGLVANAFNKMVGPCDDMAAALATLWTGFLLIAISYLCLWISSIVVVSRLRFYNEFCTDADAAGGETNKV
mmetsp:Transcript_16229/g.39593  ORF Transcript_16229/g.39593 Transcript_16229/m.39593 type:complete len:805 (+) Transcript_16229:507-2921(+)